MIIYRELSSLEADLGIRTQTLYALSNSIEKQYRHVKIAKHDGSCRNLSVPGEQLKRVQRSIAEKILIHIPISPYAAAYRYGASVQKNAQPHVGKQKLLKLDILHFFDSIRYATVKDKVFSANRFSEPIRILLSMLCYYRDVLPQGAPSSPAITNIIMREFDDTVGKWCSQKNISYTRYCDDMTFSGDFSSKEVINFVQNELRKMGFVLNNKKTAVIPASKRQTVTGMVVNEKLSVPAFYRRSLRQEIHYCKKYGVASHLLKTNRTISEEQYLQSVLGKINFVLQAAPSDTQMLAAKEFIITELKKMHC